MAQTNRLGPKVGGHPALVQYSSNEPGELSQWLRHDDSTVNIVVTITLHLSKSKVKLDLIIIIIIIIIIITVDDRE